LLKYLLDTNIASYTIKHKPASVHAQFKRNLGRMAISTITVMELVYGAEHSTHVECNLAVIEGFTARLVVLDYDHAAAWHSGQIRAELRRNGQPIGPYDQMLAGHARSRGLTLVTNNTGKFQRVPGLLLENWV